MFPESKGKQAYLEKFTTRTLHTFKGSEAGRVDNHAAGGGEFLSFSFSVVIGIFHPFLCPFLRLLYIHPLFAVGIYVCDVLLLCGMYALLC